MYFAPMTDNQKHAIWDHEPTEKEIDEWRTKQVLRAFGINDIEALRKEIGVDVHL